MAQYQTMCTPEHDVHHITLRQPMTTTSSRLFRARRLDKTKLSHNVQTIVNQSNQELAAANTVFPLKLFRDTVTLDRTKLTITRRDFFFSSDVMSIRIEDILSATASVGPFFGTLTIATRVLSSDDHFKIDRLWRSDAIHLKHMIQGYVIAKHNNIPCDNLSFDELMRTLRELGHDSNGDRRLRVIET